MMVLAEGSRVTLGPPNTMSDEVPPSVLRHGGTPDGKRLLALCLTSLGVVYGDIGTSPLYSVRECFYGVHAVPATHENVLGVLSLVIWALVIVISVKYLAYVMRASNRGEGGELALMALALHKATPGARTTALITMLGLCGASLLYGDGMVTPAISVLSAVEGLEVAAPGFEHFVVPITVAILVGLFLFQKRGTARVGSVFGPVTLLWFVTLAALGMNQILRHPSVLWAILPTWGVSFLVHNQLHGFLTLGAVFLAITGGEALYADMGHFGPKPIRFAWYAVVMPALVLNYLGQGALLLSDPASASNPFYRMAPSWALFPLLGLATCATVIASQAVISGAFSVTRQATMLGYLPRVFIQHTSAYQIGQIYVPAVNWVLMVATIALVLGFRSSSNLAAAYGIAVTTSMVITTLLAYVVARKRWGWGRLPSLALTGALLVVDLSFFSSNIVKIAQGGWVPVAVAVLVFTIMTTWKRGRTLLGQQIQADIVPLEDFFELMTVEPTHRVPGAAVFMTSNPQGTPPALLHNFMHNHAVHERVMLLTILTEDVPYVDPTDRVAREDLREGFSRTVARYGFMESPDVVSLLESKDVRTPPLEHTTFFLGHETLLADTRSGMLPWRKRLFSFLSRNALRPTTFYNIPTRRVVEIGYQVSL